MFGLIYFKRIESFKSFVYIIISRLIFPTTTIRLVDILNFLCKLVVLGRGQMVRPYVIAQNEDFDLGNIVILLFELRAR